MSQNNNDHSGIAFAFAIIGVMAIAIAAFVFAVFAFFALVGTIIAIIAWDKPLVVRGEVWMEPHEARAFVYRGLAGMVLVPVFAAFCVILFQTPLIPEAWPWLFLGGYVGGSAGIEYLIHQEEQERMAAQVEIIPPPPVETRAVPKAQPRPQDDRPFEYARWDDEDARR